MECWKFARYHRPLIVVIVKNEYLCVVADMLTRWQRWAIFWTIGLDREQALSRYLERSRKRLAEKL